MTSDAQSFNADASGSAYRAGDEPIPGYHLIQPLGKGGFGEVWKVKA